jgi:hypothetical protein
MDIPSLKVMKLKKDQIKLHTFQEKVSDNKTQSVSEVSTLLEDKELSLYKITKYIFYSTLLNSHEHLFTKLFKIAESIFNEMKSDNKVSNNKALKIKYAKCKKQLQKVSGDKALKIQKVMKLLEKDIKKSNNNVSFVNHNFVDFDIEKQITEEYTTKETISKCKKIKITKVSTERKNEILNKASDLLSELF